MNERRCPECHSGQWYSKNGPTGAQETCRNPWHEEQRPSNQSFARALAAGVVSSTCLFASMLFALAGYDYVAGWLAVGMLVSFFIAIWFGLGDVR